MSDIFENNLIVFALVHWLVLVVGCGADDATKCDTQAMRLSFLVMDCEMKLKKISWKR